ASFVSHNNTLELVWSIIPAIVMTLLVVGGLDAWNEVMADVGPDEEHIEIEVTGSQFLWYLRYPGPDGKLGTKNFRKITPSNPLGQEWTDTKNLDDFQPGEIVLPVNKKVRVRITARDVLHNFDLPHFRVKMDAIPGLPTYFVFTPTTTTEEYRARLGALDENDEPLYPEWHDLYDPEDPESGPRYKSFDYELACAELCGKGHFSMRKKVRIVTEAEYEAWLKSPDQSSFYLRDIRNTDEDPYKGKLLDVEIKERSKAFKTKLSDAVKATKPEDKILRLEYVTFMTGSAELTKLSRYQLKDLANAMRENPEMTIELAGHTDSAGDDGSNLLLSQARAEAVYNYLTVNENIEDTRMVAAGYGEARPIDTNDTQEGRKKNRRTEFQILTY
ncbi:MAG: OmpA family protein, partial [Saprospiraceae bacterium]